MRIPPFLQTILLVAVVRYLALSATNFLYFHLPQEQPISVFHYPANAVCIVALLVAGYWAVIGIALGSTIWNIFHTSISFISLSELFLASVISCFLSLWIYRTFIKPAKNSLWERPSLLQFFLFTLIFSVLIVIAAQIAFIIVPEIEQLSSPNLIKMLFGNFFAVIVVYVLLNLIMSLYIILMKFINKAQ